MQNTSSAAVAATDVTGSTMHGKKFIVVFGALILALFVSSLSETIAATALPTIAGDLKGVEIMQWISTSYILTSSITMPIYGKLGDMFGRKYLLMAALFLYALGKVFCGIAPDMNVLLIGRCISGLGGGGIPILAQAAISDIVPPRKLGVYLGVMGAVLTISLVIGPILGGWFVQVTGWRWIFWFTVPFALISTIPMGLNLHQKPISKNHAPIDKAGIVFLAASTTSFVLLSAISGKNSALGDIGTFAMAAVFALSLLLFIRTEKKAQEPILPMSLFKNRNFNLCSLVGLLLNIGIIGVITYLPTYFQIVDRMTPTFAGIIFAPMALGTLLTSMISGALASKTGRYKWMPIAMAAVSGFGFYLLSTLKIGGSAWTAVLYLTILGAGVGLGLQILTLIVQNEFSHALVGTATGANRFFRQIGSTLGASLVGALFTSRLSSDLADKIPKADNITLATITPAAVDKLPEAAQKIVAQGYSEALIPLFTIFIPIAAACLILMLFLKENPLAKSVEHKGAGKQ